MGVIKFFVDVLMAFVPPLMFVPQLLNMKKEMNAGGYSKYVSLLVILSNLLRLCYRIGVAFSAALVLQSVLQVFLQLYIVYEILKIQEKCDSAPSSQRRHSLWTKKYLGDFWDWDVFRYYVYAVASVGAALLAVSLLMSRWHWFFGLVGVASTATEAFLSLPQYLKNRRERSTEGLSIVVVCVWAGGDFLKLVYHAATHQPALFGWCAFVQLVIDSRIAYQFTEYSQKPFMTQVNANLSTICSALPVNYLPVTIPPIGLDVDTPPESVTPDPDINVGVDSEGNVHIPAAPSVSSEPHVF